MNYSFRDLIISPTYKKACLIFIVFSFAAASYVSLTGVASDHKFISVGVFLGSTKNIVVIPEIIKIRLIYFLPLYFIGAAITNFESHNEVHLATRFKSKRYLRKVTFGAYFRFAIVYGLIFAGIGLIIFQLTKTKDGFEINGIKEILKLASIDFLFYLTLAVFLVQLLFNVTLFWLISQKFGPLTAIVFFILFSIISLLVEWGPSINPCKGFLDVYEIWAKQLVIPIVTIQLIFILGCIMALRGGKRFVHHSARKHIEEF